MDSKMVLDPITAHHLRNLENKTYLDRGDGHISTVSTAQDDWEGVPMLYPTIWDGKELPREEAMKRAYESGAYVMATDPGKKGHLQLREFDKKIHGRFEQDLRNFGLIK